MIIREDNYVRDDMPSVNIFKPRQGREKENRRVKGVGISPAKLDS